MQGGGQRGTYPSDMRLRWSTGKQGGAWEGLQKRGLTYLTYSWSGTQTPGGAWKGLEQGVGREDSPVRHEARVEHRDSGRFKNRETNRGGSPIRHEAEKEYRDSGRTSEGFRTERQAERTHLSDMRLGWSTGTWEGRGGWALLVMHIFIQRHPVLFQQVIQILEREWTRR